jgi:UDP-N-acetyl-D-mannosaminuronate dehydrogenase
MLLFVGLGRMGLPMAQHALRAGLDVRGYDVTAERMALFEKAGGRTVTDLAVSFREADAIMIMAGSHYRATTEEGRIRPPQLAAFFYFKPSVQCLLMAISGRANRARECLLSG